MRIIFRDINAELVAEWRSRVPAVDSEHADIFSSPAQYLVSPANSFGFMDGGIDAVYTRRFGDGLQRRLQQEIKRVGGEMLVGTSVVVPTFDDEFPFVVCAPTMRVPMRIMDPFSVRLATRAAFKLALHHSGNSETATVIFPGMGTATGRVPVGMAASLMGAGIEDVLWPRPFPASWQEAATDHFRGQV